MVANCQQHNGLLRDNSNMANKKKKKRELAQYLVLCWLSSFYFLTMQVCTEEILPRDNIFAQQLIQPLVIFCHKLRCVPQSGPPDCCCDAHPIPECHGFPASPGCVSAAITWHLEPYIKQNGSGYGLCRRLPYPSQHQRCFFGGRWHETHSHGVTPGHWSW